MSVILVVEDDESIAETVTDILQNEGHTVVQAVDGNAALAMLADPEQPCVVLLDLMMPGMNGDALLDAMQQNKRLAGIPVVVTSAVTNAEAIVRGRAKAILRKPFELSHLLDLVSRYCMARPCRCAGAVGASQ